MIQAEQKALVQEANIHLVNIRNFEIEYFRNFFTQFGTQCALMIGFITGSVSQAPALANPTGAPYPWIVMYWIGSAGTVAAATHVLVCTVFIAVFGQGLAIRGPLGSMIKAIDGMIVEQQQVLLYYVITVIFFAFQAIGMYWVMMDSISAIVSTVITFIAMIFWYHHALRIYNRFYWDKDDSNWDNDAERSPDEALDELYPDIDSERRREQLNHYKSGKWSIVRAIGLKTKKGKYLWNPHTDDNPTPIAVAASSTPYYNMDDVTSLQHNKEDIGGYLSLRLPERKKMFAGLRFSHGDDLSESEFGDDQSSVAGSLMSGSYAGGSTKSAATGTTAGRWQRRYFIVHRTLMFYYKDHEAYQSNPSNPINKRPIDLDGYMLVAGSMEPPYFISLVPGDPEDIRRAWKFRCDTIGEFESWISIISDALRKCKSPFSCGEVLRMQGHDEVSDFHGSVHRGVVGEDDDDDEADTQFVGHFRSGPGSAISSVTSPSILGGTNQAGGNRGMYGYNSMV